MSIAANAPWSLLKLRRSGMFVLWFMERFVPLLRMNWDHELFLRKSGIGLPLSQYFVVAFANQTHGSWRGLN